MKYTIDVNAGVSVETLEFRGMTFTRTTHKTSYGSTTNDEDFCEQLEEAGITNSELLDNINDALDGFLADTLLEIEEEY